MLDCKQIVLDSFLEGDLTHSILKVIMPELFKEEDYEKIVYNAINKAVNFTLTDKQVACLKGEQTTWDRQEGYTTVYCIHLALSIGDILDMRNPLLYCDYPHKQLYAATYFKKCFMIFGKL